MKEAAAGGGGDGFVRADQIDLKSLDEQLDRHLARAWTMDKPKRNQDHHHQQQPRQDWEADPARLVVRGVIARGTFGTVHRGLYDGLDVAVKLLDWGEDGHRSEQEITAIRAAFSQEVSVWHKLDHPNVTKFIGAIMGAGDLNIQTEDGNIGIPSNVCCVIVEYLSGGALKIILIKNRRRKLSCKVVVQISVDLARGNGPRMPCSSRIGANSPPPPPPSPCVRQRPREELEPQRWSMVPSPSSLAREAWAAETAGSVRPSRCRPSTLEDNVFVQLICTVSMPGC